jgi:hypothetical protein
MRHDTRDYDRVVNNNRARAAESLQRHKDVYDSPSDPRHLTILSGVNSICNAVGGDALVQRWAERALADAAALFGG